MSRRFFAAAGGLVALTAAVAGCGGSADTNGSSGSGSSGTGSAKLALVAYSTPQSVYAQEIPAFNKTPAGGGVSFSESYGASGDQSRAVANGLPADVVNFALEPDVTRLVKAGVVARNWSANPHHGIVSDSVVVFVVRKGNPKNIHTWNDLLNQGVSVLTPNPFSSGGAKWNLLAGYGAQLHQGQSSSQALGYLNELISKHVKAQDKSATDALADFTSGNGDVLLSYENEAIKAQKKGKAVDYVIPAQTILIETPIAVTSNSSHSTQADAFRSFLWSSTGQTIFAKSGYRPVDPAVAAAYRKSFPIPPGLFTIQSLGGWTVVDHQFFDPTNGAIAKIEANAGVSTAK